LPNPVPYPLDLDTIKATWPVHSVLQHLGYSPGQNNRTVCPLCITQQSTPSPTLSYNHYTWNCFRCGEHGNIFHLIMKTQNIPFTEAVRLLHSEGSNNNISPIYKNRTWSTHALWLTITEEDEKREREDFIRLDQGIKLQLDQQVLRIKKQNLPPDEESDAIHIAQTYADELWESLDKTRASMLYTIHQIRKEEENPWADKPPTTEGWYWIKRPEEDQSTATKMHVFKTEQGLMVKGWGLDYKHFKEAVPINHPSLKGFMWAPAEEKTRP
jgi:hypothetical protein